MLVISRTRLEWPARRARAAAFGVYASSRAAVITLRLVASGIDWSVRALST